MTIKTDKKKKNTIDVGDGAAIPSKSDKGLFNAWRVALLGAISIIIYLAVSKPDPYWDILKFIPDGVATTFQVTVEAILLALVIGLFAGMGRISNNTFINGLSSLYVEVVRGIPLLVQLFYIYFALGRIVRVPAMASAVIAMGICYGAYMAEIVRAGIFSVHKGQMEAARSLGMTHAQAMTHVILPQAIRNILPAIGNEFVSLLKDSSLVSILAISDLLRRGREFASQSFTYFEAYTMVALVYLLITLVLSKIISIMEERLNVNSN